MLVFVLPIFFAAASAQLHAIISRNFAAALPVGSISYLNYSIKVAHLFASLLGTVLSAVLYPHMSKLAAGKDIEKLKKTVSQGIVCIAVIILPICMGVFILAEPGIRILFERGAFTAMDTSYTAAALRMYVLLLLSGSIYPLILRAFHAMQNTKTPAIVAMVAVAIGIGFNFLLIRPLGVSGLALSGSLSAVANLALLLFFLRKKLGAMELNLHELLKMAVAAIIMGTGVWFAADFLPLMYVPIWQSALLCGGIAASASVLYLALLLAMKSETGLWAMRRFMSVIVRGK